MTAVASKPSLGILETTGYTPVIVALDAMEKGADITILQAELNDFYGVVLKNCARSRCKTRIVPPAPTGIAPAAWSGTVATGCIAAP